MSARISTFAWFLAASLGLSSVAHAQVETVIVTAERMGEASEAPHLSMPKRADHLITRVNVVCDTRDLSQRREELKATLRNMIRQAAATSTISLGIGDKIVGELTEANFDSIIFPDTRVDTSRATVIIKTKVSQADTYNDATARITDFIARITKVGRTEVLRDNDWDLTIVGPEQYRDAIMALIVADAKHTADAFGTGYGINIEGLEHQVSWYQKGPLDLGLYIPYTLKITPLAR
jgi:hypothetical protein